MRGKPINCGILETPKTELPALLPTVNFAEKWPLNPGHPAKISPDFRVLFHIVVGSLATTLPSSQT
jgi:hypothetical protein